jgi:hypothetical protein
MRENCLRFENRVWTDFLSGVIVVSLEDVGLDEVLLGTKGEVSNNGRGFDEDSWSC